ncbi:MAG: chemotaxis protein CheX [Bryobacteraceae bacterium]|jgi:chemotaxis protein CheX
MTHDQKVAAVREAAHNVFETMLGTKLQDREPTREAESPKHSEGVVALIGLAGDWAGTGAFRCSANMARKVSGLLLMQEFPAVDQEVLDAVGEITNMVLGNVKTAFEEILGPMGLSIPTVIYGRNFTTRSVGRNEWTVVPFELDGEVFEIQISLARRQSGRGSDSAQQQRLSTVLSMES